MRTFKRLFPAALLALALAAAGAPAASAAPSDFYGNANAGDFLANLQVGDTPRRDVDYRFKAEATGTIASVSVFFIFDLSNPGPGHYNNGNGGDIQFKLWNDNAGKPGSTLLCTSTTVTDPLSGSGERAVAFSGCPAITAGTVYHIVAHNTDPDPVTNFTSLDDMAIDTPVGQRQPGRPDSDLATQYRDNGGSWVSPTPRSPVFALNYTDGTKHGPGVPYNNARSSSFPKNIGGSNKIGENITPSSAKTVTGACVRVQKNVATPAAGIHLFIRTTVSGSPVLRQVTTGLPATTGVPQWLCGSWTALALSAGTNYRLAADSNSSGATNYTTWPLTQISWASPWKFTDGFAEFSSDNGATWPDAGSTDDWQMYMTTT